MCPYSTLTGGERRRPVHALHTRPAGLRLGQCTPTAFGSLSLIRPATHSHSHLPNIVLHEHNLLASMKHLTLVRVPAMVHSVTSVNTLELYTCTRTYSYFTEYGTGASFFRLISES